MNHLAEEREDNSKRRAKRRGNMRHRVKHTHIHTHTYRHTHPQGGLMKYNPPQTEVQLIHTHAQTEGKTIPRVRKMVHCTQLILHVSLLMCVSAGLYTRRNRYLIKGHNLGFHGNTVHPKG